MTSPVASSEPPPAPMSSAAVGHAPRTTSKSVLFKDKLAGVVIRIGGLGVIVALLGILAFLVGTVIPLFQPASFAAIPIAGGVPVEGSPRFVAVDEYRILGVAVGDRAEVVVFRPDDPREVIARLLVPDFEGTKVVAAHRALRNDDVVIATVDGRVALLEVAFSSDFLLDARLPELRASMKRDEIRTLDGGVIQRVAGGNLLRVRPRMSVRGVVALPKGSGAIRAVGYSTAGETGAVIAVTEDRALHIFRQTTPEGGGVASYEPWKVVDGGPAVPLDPFAAFVDEEVRTAWVVGHSGGVLRIDLAGQLATPIEVGAVPNPKDPASRWTAAALLIGGHSLLLGDAGGGLSIWSLVRKPDAELADEKTLVRLHVFPSTGSAVTTISASPLRRTFLAGHSDGNVTLCYATNSRVIGAVKGAAGAVVAIAAGPKDDGMLVVGPGGAYRGYSIDNPHPETNVEALFKKVHYEGYDAPDFKYQSSAATQEAEVKISLMPLLFGTLKGTFYAMLFALPLALLAAIYTSQFMHQDLRAVVKPGIEVMASLPSVVLGFLAALVIAPAVEKIVPSIFAILFAAPLVAFLAGCAWHAAPDRVKHGTPSWAKLTMAVVLLTSTIALCTWLHDPVAEFLFGGDFKAWLRGDAGYGNGSAILMLALLVFGSVAGLVLLPRLTFARLRPGQSPRSRAAITTLYVLAPGLVLAAATPWINEFVFGGDFRRFLIGDKGTIYDSRNSLVVGLAMGFAVIPIIYTIAEDALIAIPDSLKSASLACGASPWQTAMRVVLPAAVPGVFSAVMIGLGRAIGETMIVVMATGGTAIMDWSIWNGFRTLSANIATELPEAPAQGTLYRVLFLAGLLLFVLTFVVNTVAEIVRIRFRKKFRGL